MNKYEYKKAVEFLNGKIWHDSVLFEVRINRANSQDQVIIYLDLISNDDTWESQRVSMIFDGCYHIGTKFNGGVDCISEGEMISGANANYSDPQIENVKDTWKNLEVDLSDVFYFSMVLASTGSTIDVVCKSVSEVVESERAQHKVPPPILPDS